MSRRSRKSFHEPFIAHPLSMRTSAAWRKLPANAKEVLFRLEIEHLEHGGSENGNLVCTYDDFERAGIRRASVAQAIRECEALGFLEVKVKGGRAISDLRFPSRYRLTYLIGRGKSPDPTHEWRQYETDADVIAALAGATTKLSGAKSRRKKILPDAKTRPEPDAKTRLRNGSPGRENASASLDAKTRLLSISRIGVTPEPDKRDSQADSSGVRQYDLTTLVRSVIRPFEKAPDS